MLQKAAARQKVVDRQTAGCCEQMIKNMAIEYMSTEQREKARFFKSNLMTVQWRKLFFCRMCNRKLDMVDGNNNKCPCYVTSSSEGFFSSKIRFLFSLSDAKPLPKSPKKKPQPSLLKRWAKDSRKRGLNVLRENIFPSPIKNDGHQKKILSGINVEC